MANGDKNVQFVAKLNELTQKGTLKWDVIDPPDSVTEGTDDKISLVYTARIDGRTIGVYEISYRDFDPDRDASFWNADVQLVLFDEFGRITYKFPRTPGRSDLIRSIQHQTSRVGDLVDSLLKR